MKRWDLINYLIRKNNYKSYLEIGTRKNETFSRVKINKKVGVDPESGGTHRMTSDEFFKQNKDKFDIVFIDGLHLNEQVKKDIENSLACLNEAGTIVCHDMNPKDEINQQRERVVSQWNGDCWKAWANLRRDRNDLKMFVLDIDHGLGVIQRGEQATINYPEDKDWQFEDLQRNRKNILNLIPVFW